MSGCANLATVKYKDGEEECTLGSNDGVALYNTTALQNLYIGRDLTYKAEQRYGYSPFYETNTLTNVEFTESGTVRYIYDYLLSHCYNVESLTLPQSLITVGNYSLSSMYSLGSIFFPGNTQTIGHHACYENTSMTRAELSNSVISIGSYGLALCDNLTEVILSESLTLIPTYLLYKDITLPHLTIPAAVQVIDEHAVQNCTLLKTLNITAGGALTNINKEAFADDETLESVTLSSPNLTIIAESAFRNDTKMKTLDITIGNKLVIKEMAFRNCSALQTAFLTGELIEIKDNAFAEDASLSTLTLRDADDYLTMGYNWDNTSSNKTNIRGLFRDCPIENLYLGRWVMYETKEDKYSPFAFITQLNNLQIGPKVKLIGKYAFKGCSSLENLHIPDNVTTMGLECFMDCSKMKQVRLSENLISLGENGFANNVSLPEITLPASLDALSDGTFMGCTTMTTANLGNTLNTIGPRAFKDCTNLVTARIPNSVYGLGVESFQNCVSLPYIEIANGISNVGARSFQGCTNAEYVTLSQRVSSLGEDCFEGCEKIKFIKSYNDFPPEGLPGFADNVKETAILYVPEYSTDMYEVSPTWEDFLNIREISDEVVVVNITLNTTAESLTVGNTLQLTATCYPADALNTTMEWSSDNTNVATVDNTGIVRAVSPGVANITATAADGGGATATCVITVTGISATEVTLSESEITLKNGATATLTATLSPESTTTTGVTWASDNDAVATVSADGVVTAHKRGRAIITATANDDRACTAQCVVNVFVIAGDANNNDKVNVNDAVVIARHILGFTSDDFNYEAADANLDGEITAADASTVVKIMMNEFESAPANAAMAKASRAVADDDTYDDYLTISNTAKNSIALSMPNTARFVAVQTDITLPEGANIEALTLGNAAARSHKLFVKKTDATHARVVVFSVANELLGADDAVIELAYSAPGNIIEKIECTNIVAADDKGIEYRLGSTIGTGDTSGIDAAQNNDTSISVDGNKLHINNPKMMLVKVYGANGTLVLSTSKAVADHYLPSGVYVVNMGKRTEKVVLK